MFTQDVGLALRATPEKQSTGLFSNSGFRVYFVKTKKIETGQKSCLYFLGSPSWTRTNDIVINSHALYRLSYWGIYKSQHLPIFPGRLHPSIFGTTQFNFRVRHGNGWDLSAIGTGLLSSGSIAIYSEVVPSKPNNTL